MTSPFPVGIIRASGATSSRAKDSAALHAAVSANADQFAEGPAPVLVDLRERGITSLGGIAAALSARCMLTRCGGRWQVPNVRNLLARLDAAA